VSSREERIAQNEAASREINEGIEDAKSNDSSGGYVRMLCECGQAQCDRVVAITVQEYEAVRRDPRTFAVAKEHVEPEMERVVSETDRFSVVQKREGTPAEVAEDLDPRS
jgi:hypothetical protein